uniref:Uncharacterized protein n=1 Tax=Lygus hesperus TaxID=30085 RepID=A0A0A9WIT4_LYGHE
MVNNGNGSGADQYKRNGRDGGLFLVSNTSDMSNRSNSSSNSHSSNSSTSALPSAVRSGIVSAVFNSLDLQDQPGGLSRASANSVFTDQNSELESTSSSVNLLTSTNTTHTTTAAVATTKNSLTNTAITLGKDTSSMTLTDEQEKELLIKLYDLYDDLWATVEGALRLANVVLATSESLIIVADASLLHVPFPALLPDPAMSMRGAGSVEETMPIGARYTTLITPALSHLVLHTEVCGGGFLQEC